MWIRNQKKDTLINLDRIGTITTLCGDIGNHAVDLYSFMDGIDIILGSYSNKEKALNVLDMLEESIIIGDITRVFYFPKDEEVK